MSAGNTRKNDEKSIINFQSMSASELEKLLSPEKALYLLYHLVDKNPRLWFDINQILHPNQNDNDHEIDDGETNTGNAAISNVLSNLRCLQLSELPLDTLSVITQFLSLKTCLRFSETSKFFNDIIPSYIDRINLECDINESIYNLFYKCQHLKHLTIDGTFKLCGDNILCLFPFSKFKCLHSLNLINIKFINNTPSNNYIFNGGTYNLYDLQLVWCSNIDINIWLQLTSNKHCPNLNNLTIVTCRRVSNILKEPEISDSMNEFTEKLVSSKDHLQIKNLSLTIYNVNILKQMRMNYNFINNLQKLELGLMDKRCQEEHANNISIMFQQLFSTQNTQNNDDKLYVFNNLEILLIDFCPNNYSRGYTDISPLDLKNFMLSIPFIFPSLKLLGLYGSHSQLLFNDHHLNGLLKSDICLKQIIDLSLGFEDISTNYDNLLNDILLTFPNLAWLTLENEQFLIDPDKFINIVKNIKNTKDYQLQWITICASEKEEIIQLENGIFVEYWDRGIENCDFDMALYRSQQIVNQRLSL